MKNRHGVDEVAAFARAYYRAGAYAQASGRYIDWPWLWRDFYEMTLPNGLELASYLLWSVMTLPAESWMAQLIESRWSDLLV